MKRRTVAPPVLVVDDDAAVRKSLKWLLEGDGYRVTTAATGGLALAKLRHGLKPCLILLDLTMPDMDGFEFRQHLMSDPGLSTVPVVVYSGHGEADPVAQSLGIAFFEKPFDIEAVRQIVKRHCLAA